MKRTFFYLIMKVEKRSLFYCVVLVSIVISFRVSEAQPQAPIDWGDIQWLPIPALAENESAGNLWSHGDTLIAVAVLQLTNPNRSYPELAFSTDNGTAFSEWVLINDQDTLGIWASTTCQFALIDNAIICRAVDPQFPHGLYFGFWKTIDLGQTWEWPVQTLWQLHFHDQRGDTLFCRAGVDSVTWTSDEGHTFAPRRCAHLAPMSIGDLAVSNQSVHVISSLTTDETGRQRIRYVRAPLLGGEFDPAVIINPEIGWTDRAVIDFGDDGTGMILSCNEYNLPAPDHGAIVLNITHDDGVNWSPADTLTPNESAAYDWLDLWHWNHWWMACWIDTVRDPGFTRWGLRCAFSPNNGRFWYPSQQIDGSGDYRWYDLSGEILASRISINMSAWRWIEQPPGYYYTKWEGQIHPDTILPNLAYAEEMPLLVPLDTMLSFYAQAIDNDSLWLMQVIAYNQSGDTVIIPMQRDIDDTYHCSWQTPQDTILWYYYYHAEDMWENISYYPADGPANPFIVHVGAITSITNHEPLAENLDISIYPNPFNPLTMISFSLSHSQRATISVYDLTGRMVSTLADEVMYAGEHSVTFDAAGLPSGIYFARMTAGSEMMTKKMVLMR